MVILVILGGIGGFGLSFFYLFTFGSALNEGGFPQLILMLGIVAGFMFILLMTITKANGSLFRSRDYDLLMSLPLKPSVIVASKLVNILAINYLTFAFVYFPSVAVYAIFNATNATFWLLVFPTFLLIPLLPIAVSSVIAYLFGFITPKIRYKNLTSILFSFMILFLFMYASFQSTVIEEDPTAFATFMKGILGKIYYPGEIAFAGMLGDWKSYLIFIAISIIPFAGFVWLVSKNFVGANSRGNSSYVNKNFRLGEQHSTDQRKALIIKEMKRYFGSPIYVLNTLVGPIMSTFFMLFMFFGENSIVASIPEADLSSEILAMVITAMVIFSLGMTSTTAASISIEGKQFWILKSLPVPAEDIFFAKIFVNLFITIPFLIVDVILSLTVFKFNFFQATFMLLIPALMAVIMSCGGLYFNLLMPRFDYENDMRAVKQSLSVLITMLFGFASVLVTVGLGVIGILFLNTTFGYLFAFLGALALAALAFVLVKTHGVKLFKRLNA
jgi:ABC-2 type transport system permease protein